jgi:galactokinase
MPLSKPAGDWTLNTQARAEHVSSRFRERFASEPELWVRAPGRVDLMGSHTDYNLGFVLTLPISRDAWIAARRTGDGTVRVHSMNLNDQDEFRVDDINPVSESRWRNYVRGVAATLRDAGFALTGCEAVIHSTVPLESGLSSSAALECAVATLFESLGGWNLTPERKALLCQKAENAFVGVNCGILDQYSSCLGQQECSLLLDCRDLSTRVVPIAGGIRVVACNTMSRRRLSSGEYSQRRAECAQGAALLGLGALRDVTPRMLAARWQELPQQVAKRCAFIVAESARAEALAGALEAGDRSCLARLCEESFAGARDLYEICSPAMETMMDAMLAAPGVIGARQAGAGFGGCMVALVEDAHANEFRDAVSEAYCSVAQVRPEIYPVEAAPGASVFEPEQRRQWS